MENFYVDLISNIDWIYGSIIFTVQCYTTTSGPLSLSSGIPRTHTVEYQKRVGPIHNLYIEVVRQKVFHY